MLKKIFFAVFLIAILSSSRGYSDDETLSLLKHLGDKISGIKSLETGFIQEKRLAIFSKPVILEGRVFIQEPDLFSWHTDKPVRYVMVISGDVIRQWDEDSKQVQTISLSQNPVFSVAINQMKIWFSGDYIKLLDDYNTLVISKSPAILEFSPKSSSPSAGIIKKVKVTLRKDERYIERIDIEEKNDNFSSILFVNTKINPAINPSNWELK
jgi:outer membrane lipoprotein-sorting protein